MIIQIGMKIKKNKTAANNVLAKCGVEYKIENLEIFTRRCFLFPQFSVI